MAAYIQVITTVERQEDAERIARHLVENRLAACVQLVGPIASTYRWRGAIESSREWLCLAKSRAELYAEIEAAIRQIHPYQLPEILAMPVIAGSRGYLDWLDQETMPGASAPPGTER